MAQNTTPIVDPVPELPMDGNGCGPCFFGWAVPDFECWGDGFRIAGNIHDKMYKRGGGLWWRLFSDLVFLLNLFVAVIWQWPWYARLTLGLVVPWIYFAAVRIGGAPFYYGPQFFRLLPASWHRLWYRERVTR